MLLGRNHASAINGTVDHMGVGRCLLSLFAIRHARNDSFLRGFWGEKVRSTELSHGILPMGTGLLRSYSSNACQNNNTTSHAPARTQKEVGLAIFLRRIPDVFNRPAAPVPPHRSSLYFPLTG